MDNNNITIEQLKDVIKKLEWSIDKMQRKGLDSIEPEPNTYGMNHFISFPSKGFINLNALNEYIGCEEYEDDEY